MNNYCDIKSDWSFNSNGDLNTTTDYTQSVKERIMCPKDYLKIYYADYGSTIMEELGERFNKATIQFKLEQTFNQDKNIKDYQINDIIHHNGFIEAIVTINGIEMSINIGEELI